MKNIFEPSPELADITDPDDRTDIEKANHWGAFYLSKSLHKSEKRPGETYASMMERQRMRDIFFQILPLAEERLANRISEWLGENPAPKTAIRL